MLRKWPFPNKLSEMSAWAIGLWIRRVLVRAQEGQLQTRSRLGLGRVASFLLGGVGCGGPFLPPRTPISHLRDDGLSNQEAMAREPFRRTRPEGSLAITASKVRSSVC